MRYDEMRALYPEIDDLFSRTMEHCRGEAGPEMALGWAERWIAQHISPEYWEDVTEKVHRFIEIVRKCH